MAGLNPGPYASLDAALSEIETHARVFVGLMWISNRIESACSAPITLLADETEPMPTRQDGFSQLNRRACSPQKNQRTERLHTPRKDGSC